MDPANSLVVIPLILSSTPTLCHGLPAAISRWRWRDARSIGLASAGNVTLQFLNILVGMAAAGRVPDFAEGTASRFAPGPFFYWDMR